MPAGNADEVEAQHQLQQYDARIHRSTLWKLDFLLLPFLALLFLFNALDKANVRLPPRAYLRSSANLPTSSQTIY
jgi:hypothetical protein